MAETLYIRLGSQLQDTVHWLVWSASNNEIIASGELKNAEQLTQLTEKAHHRAVTVFVPACDVALKRLTVPSKSTRAMRLAAPYMLEDELAQDVEQLFFAYGKADAILAQTNDIPAVGDPATQASVQGQIPAHNCFIAAVDRTLMQQWLAWLNNAGIHCSTLLPDVLAMPLNKKGYSAIVLNEQVIVRQNVWQGFTVDFSTWSVIFQKWGSVHQKNQQEEKANTSSDINNESSSTPLIINTYSALPNVTSIPETLTIQAMPEELPLALLAQHAQQQPFNLLQGEFKHKEQHSAALTSWLWVAGFAFIALLLNVGLKGVELLQLQSQQTDVEKTIIQTYKTAFPQTQRVRISTIKSQLKQKVAQIGADNSQQGFLTLLNKIQPAFTQVPELKIETLKFDRKKQEIRLQAITSDYQYFDRFKNALEQQALKVNQGVQNNQGEQIIGSFSISDKYPNSTANSNNSTNSAQAKRG